MERNNDGSDDNTDIHNADEPQHSIQLDNNNNDDNSLQTNNNNSARLRGLRGLRFILFIAVFGPPPLKLEEFERIPMMDITEEHVSRNQLCSICLIEFKLRDAVKHLLCGHDFHFECVKRWLLRHGTCPYCRDLLINVRIAFNNAVSRSNDDVVSVNERQQQI